MANRRSWSSSLGLLMPFLEVPKGAEVQFWSVMVLLSWHSFSSTSEHRLEVHVMSANQ